MNVDKIKAIVDKSPGLTVDGLLMMLRSMKDDGGTDNATGGRCRDCRYGVNEMVVDKSHAGQIACGRYLRYKKPDGFCDEFEQATADTMAFEQIPADTVKQPRKKKED